MDSPMLSQTAQSYNRLAEVYESRWADYLCHTHQRFMEQLPPLEGDVLLDMSCGTGLLAQKIITRGDAFQEIVLNDIAVQLQKYGKKRFSGRRDIRFTNFSAEAMAFPDQQFDKVFCLNAFHNYHHQSQVLTEIYRVLKPGGQFFLLDWNRSGLFRIINQFIKWNAAEHIDTGSFKEMKQLLIDESFHAHFQEQWYYRSWKFFFIISRK